MCSKLFGHATEGPSPAVSHFVGRILWRRHLKTAYVIVARQDCPISENPSNLQRSAEIGGHNWCISPSLALPKNNWDQNKTIIDFLYDTVKNINYQKVSNVHCTTWFKRILRWEYKQNFCVFAGRLIYNTELSAGCSMHRSVKAVSFKNESHQMRHISCVLELGVGLHMRVE